MPLFQWNDISENVENGSIILGNGASIAVNPAFNYQSLYENAIQEAHINDQINQIFGHLNTNDFELVLRMLWHTNAINQALGVEDNATTTAYQNIRNALIRSVENNHLDYPEDDDEENYLPRISRFLKTFRTVISLNYDLIVYWAVYKIIKIIQKTGLKTVGRMDALIVTGKDLGRIISLKVQL